MDKEEIISILNRFKEGELNNEETAAEILASGLEHLGYATLDTDRVKRTGIPEVIYSEGKTPEQVSEIAARLYGKGIPVMATRADREVFDAIRKKVPEATYDEEARIVLYRADQPVPGDGYIAVVSAGTSDMPVSEEAAVTAEFLGNRVERIYDVGVAGIHRLFHRIDLIRGAGAIIVVAGMEGALASVVGGLVDKPVIAVPTSAGYGANFGGITALLSMLNSCASGVSVVNINNGFGAACQAHLINQVKNRNREL